MTDHKIIHGDSLVELKNLPENSVDAVVTDPPYELGFMGKKWDASGIAYNVKLWAEVLRVLKPGGHLLAFGGTRTSHRMTVAIEDAGFEIRDSIAWIYGSGFPKSLDVSKAIDKMDATIGKELRFTKWMRSTGLTASQVKKALDGRSIWGHFFEVSAQPAIPTPELFNLLRPLLSSVEIPKWVEAYVIEKGINSLSYKSRQKTGTKKAGIATPGDTQRYTIGGSRAVEVDVTSAHTPEAQKWAGWGTALKPAIEPITVARKPLSEKTVAANVLTWGTGALNIDASRIESNGDHKRPFQPNNNERNVYSPASSFQPTNAEGRWPANVILDDEAAKELDEQSGVSKSPSGVVKQVGRINYTDNLNGQYRGGREGEGIGYGDAGGASRFFYVAKPSKKERPKADDGTLHPTVKPLTLMEYLVRLVTPEGGVVLDPFAGSGTTIEAALRVGVNSIGIEMTEEYLPLIQQRLDRNAP